MSNATVYIEKAQSENQVTRERRYASRPDGAAVNLEVYRDRGTVKVGRNVRRTAWRSKGWTSTKATEAEAVAFADVKWGELLAWLEKLEAQDAGDGAAAAFSAQVATMMR